MARTGFGDRDSSGDTCWYLLRQSSHQSCGFAAVVPLIFSLKMVDSSSGPAVPTASGLIDDLRAYSSAMAKVAEPPSYALSNGAVLVMGDLDQSLAQRPSK